MTHSIRSILALTILAIVLVACGTNAGSSPSDAASPSERATPSAEASVEPSEEPTTEPSESPEAAERDIAGTITAAEMAFSGPGGTIQEALENGPTGDELPTLVNGVLFRDTDGRVYIATSVSDEAAPTFEGPMLEVLNFPNDGPSWDLENADVVGIQEANGIVFKPEAQILGFLELP